MNKTIEEHLKERVRGTAEGCDMLHLPVTADNHYAANTYLVALHEINKLRAERVRIAKSIAVNIGDEAPDNLADCVEKMMLEEYYPAQKKIERLTAEIERLGEALRRQP